MSEPTRDNPLAGSPIVAPELARAVEPVWAALGQARGGRGCLRVLFAGVSDDAGTSLVCAATALGIAENLRQPTRLVEADLASPRQAEYLCVDASPGLSEILDGQTYLRDGLRAVPGGYGLQVIPAGKRGRPLPGELATPLARDLFETVAEGASFVLIDSPPIGLRVEPRLLFEHVDGVVLVVRARGDHRAEVREAKELVEGAGLPILGAVLNRYRSDMPFGLEL